MLISVEMQQRFSPRINSIADDKGRCNGDDQKKPLATSKDQGHQVSPRLHNLPHCKKPHYGSGKQKPLEAPNDNVGKKNIKIDHSMKKCQVNLVGEFVKDENCNSDMEMGSMSIENKETEIVNSEDDNLKQNGSGNPLVDKLGKSTFFKVKETLRAFNLHCLRMAQEEKKRCRKVESSDLQIVIGLKANGHFLGGQISKLPYESAGLVCIDISNGQEDICVPAANVIDNPPAAPSGFTYIGSIQVDKNVIVPPDAPGCNCKGNCTNPRSCSCAQLNGFKFPYVCQDGGRLIEAKDVVFECGPRCGCGPPCVNRTTQRGLRYHLEVYRTKDKGWAVRSWDFIPSGAPVCEYTGVLRRNVELDNASENDFIFEIDCWHTMNEIGSRERRLRNVSVPTSNHVVKRNEEVSENSPEFCIDAGRYGNVARFINHSCEPNLFVQCVLSSHHDIRLVRVLLFAADDIPPMQELTYDYGYELDSVVGPDGKIKKLPCNCGEADCKKRLY